MLKSKSHPYLMAVIGECDPPGACGGRLSSEPKGRRRNPHFRGLQYKRGTSLCTADLEKSQECSDWDVKKQVTEKTFLIKSIHLMGSQRHFAASCHGNSSLTLCCDATWDEGAAVAALWVEGGTLQMGPSL